MDLQGNTTHACNKTKKLKSEARSLQIKKSSLLAFVQTITSAYVKIDERTDRLFPLVILGQCVKDLIGRALFAGLDDGRDELGQKACRAQNINKYARPRHILICAHDGIFFTKESNI